MLDDELLAHGNQWAASLIKNSEPLRDYILESEFDDTSRWGEIAKIYLTLLSKRTGGLWLDAPDGYGKHTAANIAVQYLHSECDIPSVFISGSDLQFASDSALIDVYWNCLLDSFMNENGVCLVLDSMEYCSCSDLVLDRLGRIMCAYPDSQENISSLIVILIDNGNLKLPAMLRRHLSHCILTLPTKAMRYQYVNKRWEMISDSTDEAWLKPNPAIPASLIAEITEGCNFQQLVDAVDYVYYRDTATAYSDALDEMPEIDFDSLPRAEEAVYLSDALQELMSKNGTPITNDKDIYHIKQLERFDDAHRLMENLLPVLESLPEFLSETLPDLISSAMKGKTIAVQTSAKENKPNPAFNNNPMSTPDAAASRAEADQMTGAELAQANGTADLIQKALEITQSI